MWSILSREANHKYKYEANISIWCPEGIAIAVPLVYDFETIKELVNRCGKCGAEGVKTKRVAFANRVCESCLPEARKQLEKPGWCN